MPRATALLLRLRAALRATGDPRRSPGMQLYMKSANRAAILCQIPFK